MFLVLSHLEVLYKILNVIEVYIHKTAVATNTEIMYLCISRRKLINIV